MYRCCQRINKKKDLLGNFMEESQRTKLNSLRDAYQRIRNEKLATGITVNTLSGNFDITNPQIVTAVLDFLIHEVSEQIKAQVNE